MLAASLALTSFLPANLAFAEEVAKPAEEVAAPEETAVEAETNVDYLNYLEMEDYLITAERIPTNKWDTPANVTVITAKEIEDNHYQSISEALNHVNGVIDSMYNMQMTGGGRILVLVDGRRWFDPQNDRQTSKAFTGFPSMKIIERIEILKGGNSALYGSDAFNGVVNIVTKKGTKNETTIDLNTGTWRRHQYEITNQGVVDKFSWFITGRLLKNQPWDYKHGLKEDSWEYNRTTKDSDHDFSIRLDQRFTERDSLTFDVMHLSNHRRFYYPYFREYSGDYHVIINNLSMTYNFKEGTSTPGWLRYINNYYTFSDISSEKPHSRLQGIEYQNGWELGQHKIIAGLEWHKSTASYPTYGYSDASINTKSVYLQDTISMGDKWTVIPGVRYDHSSKFGNNWSPKLAANYRPDEKTKFYASWGRSYNLPLLNEMYATVPDRETQRMMFNSYYYPTFYFGNEYLRPEKGTSFNVGFEHDFDEKTGMSINFFQNKLKNSFDWTFEDWGYFVLSSAYNRIPIKSRGLEITFRQKIDDHFSYNLGYSHTHTHMEHPYIGGEFPYYRPQPNGYRVGLSYQNRGLKMNLLGTMASGINTNITTRWTSTPTIQAYPKRRYAVLDFNLSYNVDDNLTFYFKALNLTNQHYSNEESSYDSFWDKKIVSSGAGRQFIYGVNYKF